MEVRDLLKDKKFWVASFLIAWAAALQGHMMWMQRQDSFKQKFGNLKEDTDNQDHDVGKTLDLKAQFLCLLVHMSCFSDSKSLGFGGVDVKHFLSGNFSDCVCRTSS
ncbi:hypothetical protein TIFTF001_026371 [Ficus carica]|uniref:Uncharacterized protein n=1 Tax=Ficus carica TaxID=3494 RepID=A0AA88IY67_FICCA|nr:hypothetical protein TIFTF001_026371 [Ficus carica]